MAARYLFNGNARDVSRNTHHASLQGAGGTYVDDPQFGRVLSLPGGQGAFVKIPGQALDGLDAISVSGWIQTPGLRIPGSRSMISGWVPARISSASRSGRMRPKAIAPASRAPARRACRGQSLRAFP